MRWSISSIGDLHSDLEAHPASRIGVVDIALFADHFGDQVRTTDDEHGDRTARLRICFVVLLIAFRDLLGRVGRDEEG